MEAGRCDGASSEDRGSALVEIVFCSTTRGVVRLDCVIATGPGAGWPFSVEVGLPAHPALAAAAERMLTRWSDQGVAVSLGVRPHRRPAGVRLSDGTAAILLDVAGAGSVFS